LDFRNDIRDAVKLIKLLKVGGGGKRRGGGRRKEEGGERRKRRSREEGGGRRKRRRGGGGREQEGGKKEYSPFCFSFSAISPQLFIFMKSLQIWKNLRRTRLYF
jgi:hypothetical protein